MFPEVIEILKTFDRRKNEYSNFYYESFPCKDINIYWSEKLKEILGSWKWEALWQMSEENCEMFDVLYPMTVVVTVNEILYEELSASVAVDKVQDDVELPNMVTVPIFELFPAKKQSIPKATVTRIADWLDRCRFFFINLWYPWDKSEDLQICDWAEKHLENRLQLQFDMRTGKLESSTVDYIRATMSDALHISGALELYGESELQENDKVKYIENLFHKQKIQLQLEIFENSDLRQLMPKYLREKKGAPVNASTISVIPEGSISDISMHLEHLKNHIDSNENISIFPNAQSAIDVIQTGGTLFLAPGNHVISKLGCLAYGGTIKGGISPEKVVISPAKKTPEPFMFLKSLGMLHLEMLTLERKLGVLLTICGKVTSLKKCILRGNEGASSVGIVVQRLCNLELYDCVIENLGTGIILKEGASAKLENCRIRNCMMGFKMLDKASLDLNGGSITACYSSAIVFKTINDVHNTNGSLDILKDSKVAALTCRGTDFRKNTVDATIESAFQSDMSDDSDSGL